MSKKELHPKDYRYVVFSDESAGYSFLTRSTATSAETIKWEDGETYPLVKVQISSASHPFFTGEEKIIDTEGRVDRFKNRAKKAAELRKALANKAKKAAKEAEASFFLPKSHLYDTIKKITILTNQLREFL